MPATETVTKKSYENRRREDKIAASVARTVFTSAAASLIVAMLVNGFIFILTLSKLTVVMDQVERRVVFLEKETRNAVDSKYQLEIKLARQERTLEQILVEIKDVKESIKK